MLHVGLMKQDVAEAEAWI